MKRLKLSLLTLLVLLVSAVRSQELQVTLVDPLVKVFPASVFPRETYYTTDVARGETASLQVAIRSAATLRNLPVAITFSGLRKLKFHLGFVDYVYAGRQYTDQATDRLVSPDGWYPDPIIDDKPIDLAANQTRTLYINFDIPENTPPGKYAATISIGTGRALVKRQFTIHVHNVVLPPQQLWVTNWYSLDPERLALMNGGKAVPPYGDTYWLLVRQFALNMARYKQNTVLISPLHLTQYKVENGEFSFDFSRFDKTVMLFKEAGALKRIEGGHIGGRGGDWTSSFMVEVPRIAASGMVFDKKPITDEAARSFYTRFLQALKAHLIEKGWWSIYYQHLADEPIQENKQSYIDIARFVKSVVPDIMIMEACHSRELAETINLWVPQLDFLNKDFSFYQDRLKKGDEVWFYTCLSPRGNYANRFIDLPLIKTRLLHWINFKYGIKGYLHWGLNYWNDKPMQEVTGIIAEGGNVLPAGDAWIVYPGFHKLYSSIRQEAMRDGINDFALLSLLMEKNKALAEEMINNMIFRFDWYDTSISNFRDVRKRILEKLEQ